MIRDRRLVLAVLGCLALVVGMSTVQPIPTALAAPVLGSGAIGLLSINDTQTVYSSPTTPADIVAVTVTTTAGIVQVEKLASGNWVAIGSVPAGEVCVFEGAFTSLRVVATGAPVVGTYSNRGPTDVASNPDHAVGTGTIVVGSSAVNVFTSSASLARNIVVTATSGSITLRTTSTGVDIVTLQSGRTEAYRSPAGAFWLVGPGSATFTVLDDPAAGVWMSLPQAHWTDQFSPRHVDRDGVFVEGDPSFTPPSSESVLDQQIWDEENQEYDTLQYIANEAMVNFKSTTTAEVIEDLFEGLNLAIEGAWFEPNTSEPSAHISWFHVRIEPSSSYYDNTAGLISYLQGLATVDFAEFNSLMKFEGWPPEGGEEDEYYDDQVEFIRLGADQAWETETGNGICIVIMDSGVDVLHEDLTNQIFRHPQYGHKMGIAALKGKTCVGPVDKNGDLRTLEGGKPNHGHGTVVAGIAAAQSYNGTGVAGCGPDLRILSARLALTNSGRAPQDSIIRAIKCLTEHLPVSGFSATRVVNMSFGGPGADSHKSIKKAIAKDLEANDRLYVSAAGNSAKEKKIYPAALDFVLGVTGAGNGTTPAGYRTGEDGKYYNSNFYCGGGTNSEPDLSVYGVSAYYVWQMTTDAHDGSSSDEWGYETYDFGGKYLFQSAGGGTSVAAPQVSALAGLLYGKAKRDGLTVTYADIDTHIKGASGSRVGAPARPHQRRTLEWPAQPLVPQGAVGV